MLLLLIHFGVQRSTTTTAPQLHSSPSLTPQPYRPLLCRASLSVRTYVRSTSYDTNVVLRLVWLLHIYTNVSLLSERSLESGDLSYRPRPAITGHVSQLVTGLAGSGGPSRRCCCCQAAPSPVPLPRAINTLYSAPPTGPDHTWQPQHRREAPEWQAARCGPLPVDVGAWLWPILHSPHY